MSSPDRRHILSLIAALPLAACGFAPAYGPAGTAPDLYGRLAYDPPTDKNGFDLVGRLEERLGRTRTPAFHLAWQVETEELGRGITPTQAITRYTVTGTAGFTLKDSADATLAEGRVTSFTSYSATGTTVSTAAAREDAYLRLMRILADQIATRLAAVRAGAAAP